MPIEKEIFDKALTPKETIEKFLAERRNTGKGYSLRNIKQGTGIDSGIVEALEELMEEGKIIRVRFGATNYYRFKVSKP